METLYSQLVLGGLGSQARKADTEQSLRAQAAKCAPALAILSLRCGPLKDATLLDQLRAGGARIYFVGDLLAGQVVADGERLPATGGIRELLAVCRDPEGAGRRQAWLESIATDTLYKDLFERASDPIMLLDSDTHAILAVNRQAELTYGYTRAELLDMHLLELVPREEHADVLAKTMRAIGGDRNVTTGRTHIRKDGTRLKVTVSGSLLEVGGRLVFQDIVRDETARIEAEERLRQVNEELESAIGELRTLHAELQRSRSALGAEADR